MKEIKNEKIEKFIEDVKDNKLTTEQITEIFNGYQFYTSKDEFAHIILELFLETSSENMKAMLNSRKGKLYNDFYDEYGDGFLNLFIIKAVRTTDKRESLKKLFELIEDEEVELKWNLINGNHENTLHIVCLISNYLIKDEIMRFLKLFKKHNFNPLNIDDLHRNAITLFSMDNKHSEEDTKEIISFMEDMVNDFTIEVDNYIEEETEVEVTVMAEA